MNAFGGGIVAMWTRKRRWRLRGARAMMAGMVIASGARAGDLNADNRKTPSFPNPGTRAIFYQVKIPKGVQEARQGEASGGSPATAQWNL